MLHNTHIFYWANVTMWDYISWEIKVCFEVIYQENRWVFFFFFWGGWGLLWVNKSWGYEITLETCGWDDKRRCCDSRVGPGLGSLANTAQNIDHRGAYEESTFNRWSQDMGPTCPRKPHPDKWAQWKELVASLLGPRAMLRLPACFMRSACDYYAHAHSFSNIIMYFFKIE